MTPIDHPGLSPAPSIRAHLGGAVGRYIRGVIPQWLLAAPDANPAMLEMFADRDVVPYRDMVPWAGEFAGKYLTAAAEMCRLTADPELEMKTGQFVSELIALQADDGYLGPWPEDSRLGNWSPHHGKEGLHTWDTWGHYHIMLGLMLWSDHIGDPAPLDAACRVADLICDTYLGNSSRRLVDTGSTEMNLAPVHSLAMLYRRTRRDRYQEMALQIVSEFEAAGADGAPLSGDYMRLALEGKSFFEMPKPRWESLHPIMGMAELYRITGDGNMLRAFESIWWSIVERDRHNNGGFSSGEKATGNPYDPAPIETCCTIAWIAASVEMLALTENSIAADEIELSTLNSVLGMHSPSGRWVTYNTPSDGIRLASAHHIVFQARSGSPELNCCSVNGPRGFGMISRWAVMEGANGLYLNYYGPGSFEITSADGTLWRLEIDGDYPREGKVSVRAVISGGRERSLFLRIPYWSVKTSVSVDGDPAGNPVPGTYLEIRRAWEDGDLIEIELDLSLHLWPGEAECAGMASIYRGPVLLAYDLRYNRNVGNRGLAAYGGREWSMTAASLPVPTLDARILESTPAAWDGPMPPDQLFTVRCGDGSRVHLCDFASAGDTGSPYRSWLPVTNTPPVLFSRTNPLRSVRPDRLKSRDV